MSATKTRGRSRGHEEEHEEHENEERWLVSFADMMTLLFCLFMVLFAISSVNTSKFESLKQSLSESFNGQILSGGQSIMETGATQRTERASVAPTPPLMPRQAIAAQLTQAQEDQASDAAKREQEAFKALKRRLDADAKRLGLRSKVLTTIRPRGLVVRLLTDGVLFDSGQALLKPQSDAILTGIGTIIAGEGSHPVVVEGYTDDQPIASAQFPTNWELSGARASSVVRHLISDGVPMSRLSAMQFAQKHPIAPNATMEGRAKNRRVEIVLTRLNQTPAQGGAAP